jgi:hypothetical protein
MLGTGIYRVAKRHHSAFSPFPSPSSAPSVIAVCAVLSILAPAPRSRAETIQRLTGMEMEEGMRHAGFKQSDSGSLHLRDGREPLVHQGGSGEEQGRLNALDGLHEAGWTLDQVRKVFQYAVGCEGAGGDFRGWRFARFRGAWLGRGFGSGFTRSGSCFPFPARVEAPRGALSPPQ